MVYHELMTSFCVCIWCCRVPIEAIQKYVSWLDGLYAVTVFWVTREEFLLDQTVFVCRMNIPGTGHRDRRQITYPGE